jgi:hypothetical protein
MSPEGFRDDLARSLAALRAGGADDVVSFRAPYFSMNERTRWAIPIMAEYGLRIDSSVFPLRIGYYGQRSAPNAPHRIGPLHEFPITLPTVAGMRVPLTGGFYSRLFPTSWTVDGVRRVLAAGGEPMFYIHPWELDVAQPSIRVGRFLTLRHYFGLDRTDRIVAEILRRWRWHSLRESLATHDAT